MTKAARDLWLSLALLSTVTTTVTVSAAAAPPDWRRASDVGVAALLVTAVAVPLADGDRTGVRQAAVSLAAASLAIEILKASIDSERPDGSDHDSFPSGHSGRSFAAATTLYRRQGSGYGVPAMAAATFVGIARIEGDKHRAGDVIAGAALGIASGLLFTDRPAPERVLTIVPSLSPAVATMTAIFRF